MNWKKIADDGPPPRHKTVMLYREGDLYPVVGWQAAPGGPTYILEEGGTEAGDHRAYPFLLVEPTPWREIPALPGEETAG